MANDPHSSPFLWQLRGAETKRIHRLEYVSRLYRLSNQYIIIIRPFQPEEQPSPSQAQLRNGHFNLYCMYIELKLHLWYYNPHPKILDSGQVLEKFSGLRIYVSEANKIETWKWNQRIIIGGRKKKIHKYMLTHRVDDTKLPPIGECVSFAVIKDFR